MSTSESEFHRPVVVDHLGEEPMTRDLVASEAERRALATRFDIPSVERLEATVRLTRHDRGRLVAVRGRLSADVVQSCVISGDPVPQHVEETFHAGFVPEGLMAEETELDIGPGDDLDDPEPFDGRTVDVGEVVAQYLSLALDPYPRAPGVAIPEQWQTDEEDEPETEAKISPFAALDRLKQ